MNNSKIALDNFSIEEQENDRLPELRKREVELVRTIEAINVVADSEAWSTLKELLFDSLEQSLERRLKSESEKSELNSAEIYRLQGQLVWAKKYGDFKKLCDFFRLELSNIRKQIK